MQTKTVFEVITVDKAKRYLANNKRNRPMNKVNLAFLESEMKRDRFHLTGESIKIAEDGTLLDGQHRLLAIVNSGKPQKMLVVSGLDNDAFKFIDTGRKRTASDVLGIQGIKQNNAFAAMAKFIINFKKGKYASVAHGKTNEVRNLLTNADVSAFVEKHAKEMAESYTFGYVKENKLMSKSLLSSFHFIFKDISSVEADDFCWKLASGESLTKDSPVYLLRQKLTNDIRATRKMSRVEKLALICKTWNLYRKKTKVTMLKWDSLREPFPKPM